MERFKPWVQGKVAIEPLKELDDIGITGEFVVLDSIILAQVCAIIVDEHIEKEMQNG